MTVEKILKQSGDFGPAQWCLLSLFSVVNIFSAFHYFAQTFISLNPKSYCDECNLNNTDVNINGSCDFEKLEWKFQTLTIELNWICEEKWKSAVIQSLFFFGSVIGTFALGILSDSFGRVPILITANLLGVFGNLLTVYLKPTVWFLSVARFIAGLATDTNFFMMYIIVMEYIRPSMRTFGLNLCIGVWYCIGCMLTPWLAVATGDWRNFLLCIAIPTLVVPISCFFIPESAQWLLSVGRINDAIECFNKLANFNNKTISQESLQQFKVLAKNNTSIQKTNFWGLFKTPCLRRKTCILIFKSIVLTLCYDAMARNIEKLNLDPFTAFTVTSASIFPSCVMVLLLQDKIGRKSMAVFSLLLTGIFSLGQAISLILFKNSVYLVAIIGLFGRFFVNIAYNSGTQYAAELIPTQVRGQGLAAMHVVGYGAAFFSPYILYMSNFWIAIPEAIFGILSFAGATFCVFLPETLGKPLPCTLLEGEVFGEEEGIFDFLKRKKIQPIKQNELRL